MLAVQPRGHDGGDEELRAVATRPLARIPPNKDKDKDEGKENSRVRTSVGHGEDTRLGVLDVEVLIGELLAVDGTATSTLEQSIPKVEQC